MTFIDFKKLLLDAELTIPKFTALIKVSEKNIQAYKKKKRSSKHNRFNCCLFCTYEQSWYRLQSNNQ